MMTLTLNQAPAKTSRVDQSVLRVSGRELQPIIAQVQISNESLSDISRRLNVQLMRSDPTSREGRELRDICVALSHIQSGLSQVAMLTALSWWLERAGEAP
jgi:hypothetical protein